MKRTTSNVCAMRLDEWCHSGQYSRYSLCTRGICILLGKRVTNSWRLLAYAFFRLIFAASCCALFYSSIACSLAGARCVTGAHRKMNYNNNIIQYGKIVYGTLAKFGWLRLNLVRRRRMLADSMRNSMHACSMPRHSTHSNFIFRRFSCIFVMIIPFLFIFLFFRLLLYIL